MCNIDSTGVKSSERPESQRPIPNSSVLQPEAPSLADGEQDFPSARRTDAERALYHVVCRECTVEALVDGLSGATWLEAVHEDASGHHEDYAEVTRP